MDIDISLDKKPTETLKRESEFIMTKANTDVEWANIVNNAQTNVKDTKKGGKN